MSGTEQADGRDNADGGARRVIDTSVAHSARVHDYWLGGKDNFAADRAAGDAVIQAYPGIVASVRANRAFLARVVRFLAAEAGIRQFLDIGTGIPAANNTHEVAQSVAPGCRVVYVDYDPVVLLHAQALLTSSPQGALDYIDADLRDPQKILAQAAQTLDFSRPVAVMLIAIMHLIGDQDDPDRDHRAADGGGSRRELPGVVPGGFGHRSRADGRGGQAVQPSRAGDPAPSQPRRGPALLRRSGTNRTGPGPGPAMATRIRDRGWGSFGHVGRRRPQTTGARPHHGRLAA